jgi:hypothetical protein
LKEFLASFLIGFPYFMTSLFDQGYSQWLAFLDPVSWFLDLIFRHWLFCFSGSGTARLAIHGPLPFFP